MLARAILQSYLDEMGEIVMNERLEAYIARVQLPLSITTSSAKITVTSLADLIDGFDDFIEMIRSQGVTDMRRTVHAATYQGNDHIVGVYETRLLAGNRLALPAFHSKMWIGQYDGIWKAIKINNTTNEARWPMLLTRLAQEHWLSEET